MINSFISKNISLQSLIDVFSTISLHSNDIYWVACPDFKYNLFISPSYENIYGFSRDALYRDIRYWDKALLPSDIKNYHPLLELAKKIRQDRVPKAYEEKFRFITPMGEIRWIEDRAHSLYSSDGEHIGICGVAKDVSCKENLQGLSLSLLNFPETSISRYYLKGKYKNIYLTSREAECAFYLLKGKTTKESGKILKISHRTVEDLLQKIKNKLNVKYQSELIIELIESQFIQLFE